MSNLNFGLTCFVAPNVLVLYGSIYAVQIQFCFRNRDHMAYSSISEGEDNPLSLEINQAHFLNLLLFVLRLLSCYHKLEEFDVFV